MPEKVYTVLGTNITIFHGHLGRDLTYYYFLPFDDVAARHCLNLSRLTRQAETDWEFMKQRGIANA